MLAPAGCGVEERKLRPQEQVAHGATSAGSGDGGTRWNNGSDNETDTLDSGAGDGGGTSPGATAGNTRADAGCAPGLGTRQSCGACTSVCEANEYCGSAGCTAPVITPISTTGYNVADFAFDRAGNLLVAGSFSDAVDFGQGVVTPASGSDFFIAKYDSGGAASWVKTFANDDSYAIALAVDSPGNVYVTGSLRGMADFGAGALGQGSTLDPDIFTVSYDADGNYRWARVDRSQFGTLNFDEGATIAATTTAVYVAGAAGQGLDFGAGTLGNLANSLYLFVAAFDPSTGGHLRSRGFPYETQSQNGFARFTRVRVDADDRLYLSGYFRGSIDLGSGTVQGGSTSVGSNTIRTETGFIVSYTANGTQRWLRVQSDDTDTSVYDIELDEDANVYATGMFVRPLDFGGGVKDTGADLGRKMFLASYDNVGNYRFDISARNLDPLASSYGVGLALSQGNAYLSVALAGHVDFGGAELTSTPISDDNAPSTDIGLVSYDLAAGTLRWAARFGDAASDLVGRVALSAEGPVFAARPGGVIDVGGASVEPITDATTTLLRAVE